MDRFLLVVFVTNLSISYLKTETFETFPQSFLPKNRLQLKYLQKISGKHLRI